ncbi:hypothetical protein E2C01_012956 [Portunus trituberculatus]|uniref:Uncharacterized protein n=1 Tax=Portunus trituberculatus TaxID=210409 RepID=A0A5B7DG23_PORTR|nr:hypothetical protein [Portunus trituberculatus]
MSGQVTLPVNPRQDFPWGKGKESGHHAGAYRLASHLVATMEGYTDTSSSVCCTTKPRGQQVQLCTYLTELRKVGHERRSGARAKVDDKGPPFGGHIKEATLRAITEAQ